MGDEKWIAFIRPLSSEMVRTVGLSCSTRKSRVSGPRRCPVSAQSQRTLFPHNPIGSTAVECLRTLLGRAQEDGILMCPCCFDALSARLIQRAGFPITFMSGFATAAAHRALPDVGLLSFGEMVDQVEAICSAIEIPLIADGDTGYGNPINVKRTVREYAKAGAAGILIEDQVNPKRCGHTKGKSVVGREEAATRIRAAVDAREESGQDIVILARTDAAGCEGFEEALTRSQMFVDLGADITFLEAPTSINEMERYCREVGGLKFANMLEQGKTPIIPPAQLQSIGYSVVAYPLTLVSASVKAMEAALQALANGDPDEVQTYLKDFAEIRELVGFDDYYREEARYIH